MTADVRGCFSAAAEGFVAVVAVVGDAAWVKGGLGVWTVRDLVGHTSRSLTTVESYLKAPPAEIVIHDPLDYLLALRSSELDTEAIAQRGRDAGAALGSDPAAFVRSLAERVAALVAATPDEAPLSTVFGGATLAAYLPTRTFELCVHTLDLAVALGVAPPPVLDVPVAASVELAARAAARGTDAGAVLLALTGRRGLPPGFSVV